ncbi:hypothetical protein NUACC21_14160 [Scytonema sp. NUACC21]
MNQILVWFQRSLVCSLFLVSTTTPVRSQITPDNTLGAENSSLTPNVVINGANADRIDGGAQRGSNLFHSFSQFNINNGQRVYFANPSGIQNIFTRVTGGQSSNILGTLGVDGSANLFLLNPNGILFGPNARLDVRGAFLGTTANSFVFPFGVEFSATNPSAPPLLTINVPIGLQFGSQPGQIISQAVSRDEQGNPVDGLSVTNGSTLALIGGEISLDGSLLSSNGQVQLGAVGGETNVGLNVNGSELDFSVPVNAKLSPMTFTNESAVFTSGDSAIKLVGGQIKLNGSSLFSQNGGSISINATQLGLDNRSIIGTATESATKAGDIQIQASDAVTLVNRSFILSNTNNLATGNGGDIAINARTIAIAGDGTVENGSNINTLTNGQGNGGNLILNAIESVNINGGSVSVLTGGAGNAGNLTVQAGNAVSVTDKGSLSLYTNGTGSTGNLQIETGRLRVQNTGGAGGVRATNGGSGSVGSISIQARDAVEVIDGQITTGVIPGGVGRAGNITIETQRVNLRDGGQVSTDTFSSANAGNISIRASEYVDIRGISSDISVTGVLRSAVTSSTGDGATGNGGNVTIETPRLTLSGGGSVTTTSSRSLGNAGNITIRAKDVELDGFVNVPNERLPEQFQQPSGSLSFLSQLSSEVNGSDADVRGGTISVDTERLRLTNGANLAASVVVGRGQGGNLVVRATDSIEITGVGGKRLDGSPFSSGLFAELQTSSIGSGGSISVETGRLNMSNGGQISASTFNQGNAGDISIRAGQIDLRGQNTFITTSVDDQATGNAGNLSISTQGLNVRDGAQVISGTLGKGNAGNLTIQANAIELTGTASGLFSSVDTGADGNGGNLSITSDLLLVRDGAEVSSSTFGTGNAGDLTIQANQIELIGTAGLFSLVGFDANGNGGNLSVVTDSLVLRNGASIDSSTFGQGQAGDLTVNARDFVEVIGISPNNQNFSTLATATYGSGNAGRLNITTRRLSVRDGGYINTQALEGSTGKGGDVTVNATDLVEVISNSPDDFFSSALNTSTAGSGDAGSLSINTRRLSIGNGGFIATGTTSVGRGGNLNINASESIEIAANPADTDLADGIFTSTGGSGNAGDLTLSTQRLSVRNGGTVSAGTAPGSTGRGGNLTINASDWVEVAGISNDGRLQSFLSVRSRGAGQAGNITVNSPRISVKDKAAINAESFAADGGNITLNTNLLLLRRGGTISATAGNQLAGGNGGNITINARAIAAVPKEDSDIRANAFSGRGGNITISTDALFGIAPSRVPTSQSDITASSELGVQGEIAIEQPEVQPNQELIQLPGQVLDASNRIAQICPRSPSGRPLGEFIITGRGSLPPSPLEPLAPYSDLVALATLDGDANTQEQEDRLSSEFRDSDNSEIIEAQGWIKTADGKIELVASVPETTPSSSPTASVCSSS